jgi:hypothetical protein
LECRAADVEGEVEAQRGVINVADDFSNHGLKLGLSANDLGAWKAVLQLADERLGIVTQGNRAYSPFAGSNED